MKVSAINNTSFLQNKPNSASTVQNKSKAFSTAFKSARYQKVVNEVMQRGCVKTEGGALFYLKRLIETAKGMTGARILAQDDILDLNKNLRTSLGAYRPYEKLLISNKDGKEILVAGNDYVTFTGLNHDPENYRCEEITYTRLSGGRIELETSYDKYEFHENGKIRCHTHHDSSYTDTDRSYYNEDGSEDNFRNFLDFFGI